MVRFRVDMNPNITPFCPRKLINLADMIKLSIGHYVKAEHLAETRWQDFLIKATNSQQQGVLSDSEKESLSRELQTIAQPNCAKLGMEMSLHLIEQLQNALQVNYSPIRYNEIATRLLALYHTISKEASKIQFAFVPQDKVVFFEQEQLFGEQVHSKFVGARTDIKEAGNCFAAGAHTACVYHLMRVSEQGLIFLAKRLGVRTIGANTPIVYATWGQIIRELVRVVNALPAPRNRKEEAKTEFYQEAVRTCDAIKDLWRNPTSHSRAQYSEVKALAILGDVREFMQNLSSRSFRR
jgi:hypothetical protein